MLSIREMTGKQYEKKLFSANCYHRNNLRWAKLGERRNIRKHLFYTVWFASSLWSCSVYPYAKYSSVLFGAGAVSIFVGIAAVFLAPQKKQAVIRVLIFLAFLFAETVVAFLTVHNGFNYFGFLAITLIIEVLCIYSVFNYPTKSKTKNTLS